MMIVQKGWTLPSSQDVRFGAIQWPYEYLTICTCWHNLLIIELNSFSFFWELVNTAKYRSYKYSIFEMKD